MRTTREDTVRETKTKNLVQNNNFTCHEFQSL